MAAFTVGDRVKFKSGLMRGAGAGHTGTVMSIEKRASGTLCHVKLDEPVLGNTTRKCMKGDLVKLPPSEDPNKPCPYCAESINVAASQRAARVPRGDGTHGRG